MGRRRREAKRLREIDFFGRRFRNNPNEWLGGSGAGLASEDGAWVARSDYATLVTSALDGYARAGDLHAPVLDIDLPCAWVPSTAPGHGHLYINKAMPWADVVKLLDVLVEIGVVERGFRDASMQRGYTSVRTPWTKKPGVAE